MHNHHAGINVAGNDPAAIGSSLVVEGSLYAAIPVSPFGASAYGRFLGSGLQTIIIGAAANLNRPLIVRVNSPRNSTVVSTAEFQEEQGMPLDRFIGGINQEKYIFFGSHEGIKIVGDYASVAQLQDNFRLPNLRDVVYLDDRTGVIVRSNGSKVAMNMEYAREWMSNVQFPRLIMSVEKMGVSDLVNKVRNSDIIPVHLQHSIGR